MQLYAQFAKIADTEAIKYTMRDIATADLRLDALLIYLIGERLTSLTVDSLHLFRFLRRRFARRIIGSSYRSGGYSYGNECPVTAALSVTYGY